MIDTDIELLKGIANQLRIHSVEATTAAGSGHPTSCCSAADIVAALFFGHMKYDAKNPHYYNNDRFILSKGHAAPLLYAAWAENGFVPIPELLTLRQFTSELEGHPTPRLAFADVATGSLGQGLGVGVGMARAARLDKLDYNTYVLMGDGEIAEGAVWEAASLAGYYKLNNLIAIVDANRLGQSEATAFGHNIGVYRDRFKAFGWRVEDIDGHDIEEIAEVLGGVGLDDKPLAIIAKTYKGAGISFLQDKDGWHGKPLNKEEAAKAIAELQPSAKSGSEWRFPRRPRCPLRPMRFPRAIRRSITNSATKSRRGSLRHRARPPRRGGLAHRGRGRRHEKFHVRGQVFPEISGTFHGMFHRRTKHGRGGHRLEHARQSAVRVHFCHVFHPRL